MPGQRTDHEILLQIFDDVREIKSCVDRITRTLWGYEDAMGLVARVTITEKDIDALFERTKQLEALAPAMKVVIWIGAVVGVSLVGLIVSMITGQVTMVFN